MRHRNEEDDDFVVKSTGRQRVVFVAIIFVRSNAPAVSFCHFSFFPSCVATLNPTTEVNPKHFFFVFPLSLLLLLLLLGIKIGFFTFFFSLISLLLFFSLWGLVQKRRRRKCIIGCFDWERERENVLLHTHTRILAKIKRSFYSYFSHL